MGAADGGNQRDGRRLPGEGNQDRVAELCVRKAYVSSRAKAEGQRGCRSRDETFEKELPSRSYAGNDRRAQRPVVFDRSAFGIRQGGATCVEESVQQGRGAHS